MLCLCVPKFAFIQNKYAPWLVNAGLFILTLILNLNISWSKDDWKDLTDPYDYLQQSKMSLIDREFYFPHKTAHFSPRPFTLPLFYKLCGGNPDVIVQVQKVVLSLSTFFMIAAFMFFLEKDSSKYFLIGGVYLLVSSWNVLGWSILILSESLSTSLFFCWLASFLFLYKKGGARWWLLHATIMLLLSFARDSWPYVLICFYAGICLLWLLFKQPGVKKYMMLAVFSVAIFFVQQAGARIGLRYFLPVINSIVLRVIPDSARTAWFVKNGMPCAEKLQQNFGNLDVIPVEGQHKLWRLYGDTAYQPFLNWIVEKGQPAYTRFLITHPTVFFLADDKPAQIERIMSHDLFYAGEPRGYSVYIQGLFPLFNIGVVAVLCIMLVMIYTQRKTAILFAPVFLALFTLMNAILSYNADSMEVERHLFITGILVQLTGLWAIALIWDALVWRKKQNAD